MMDEEIRQAINEVREMKKMCGNINMKLTNIVTQRGQNWKEKLGAEYQRGLSEGNDIGYKDGVKDGQNEVWEAVKKIVFNPNDGGLSIQELNKIFGNASIQYVCKNYSASEAIEKLKAYEKKQSDKIEVGDEVKPFYTDITGVVTLIDGDTIYVLWRDGSSTSTLKLKEVVKTGRHFDIASILEDMKPRFNVQHPVTKEWRCFSTIVNNYVTDWMDEERYQRWRLEEYGKQAGEIRDANLMDYEEAEQRIADRQKNNGMRKTKRKERHDG